MKHLVVVLLLLTIIGCGGTTVGLNEARTLGSDMCAAAIRGETLSSANVSYATSIGPGLDGKLKSLSQNLAQGYSVDTYVGDAPSPYGDGRGTHHIIIRDHSGNELFGVRLLANGSKFDILGFWSI